MRKVYVEVGDGILLVDRDAWALTADDYATGDLVQNAGSYMCIIPHEPSSATEPGVGADWEDVWKALAIGVAGAQGIPGGVMAWKGAHSSIVTYAVNDAVFANGSGYYSLQNANLNHTPPAGTSDAYWSIFALAGSFDIHGLAAKTIPVAADEIALYSISDGANRKSTIAEILATSSGPELYVGPEVWCDYVTDGTADDVQINAALDAAAVSTSQRTVRLLPGIYDITAQITVHKHTTLSGARWPVDCYESDLAKTGYTTLDITYEAGPAIRLETGVELSSLAFWYSAQTIDGDVIGDFIQYPATAILYNPNGTTVPDYYTSKPDQVMIRDCNFMNSWIAIGAQVSHINMNVQNVFGYPLYRGVLVDLGTDPDNFHNVRFGFQYYPIAQNSSSQHLQSWVRRNAIGFEVKRCDHIMMSQCYVFDYNMGYSFNSATASGQFHLSECSADWCLLYSIYINNWKHGMITTCMLNAGANTDSGLDAISASSISVCIASSAGAGTTENIVIDDCIILSDAKAIEATSAIAVKVSGCNILEFNRCAAASQLYAVKFAGCDRSRFVDNHIDGKHGSVTGTNSAGVAFDSNCDDCVCTQNEVHDCPSQSVYFDDDGGQCFGNLASPAGAGAISVNAGSASNGDNKLIT